MASIEDSSKSNVSVGSDNSSKSNVSVGSAKGMSKKEGHYWHHQCKTCTFAVPKHNKKRVAGTLQAIRGKMKKLNDPTVQQ